MSSDFDVSIERTDYGDYVCPAEGCYSSHGSGRFLAIHFRQQHDTTLACHLVGEDAWREYLREERLENHRTPQDIATEFPSHIGRHTIEADCRRFDLYEPLLRTKPADYGSRRRDHDHLSVGLPE